MPEELLTSWNETPDTRFDNDMLNSWDPEKRAVVLALSDLASYVRGETESFGAALTQPSEASFLRVLVALKVGTDAEARRTKDAEPGKPMTVFAGRLVSGRTIDLIRTEYARLDVALYHAEEVAANDSLPKPTDIVDICPIDLAN